MNKGELIFDGNEKQVFDTSDYNKVIFRYKDVTLAFNSIKRAVFKGKGALTNKISSILLGELNRNGIATHFISLSDEDDREQLCHKIEIIPLEFTVRNRICGSLSRLIGVPEGTKPLNTIYDLHYNNSKLDDPLINEHHAVALGLATYEELERMYDIVRKSNVILGNFLKKAGLELVDLKIEFGRQAGTGDIIISDEISPDTCRIWDIATGKSLDKDRFRKDMSDVVASYREVYERLCKIRED